MLKSTTSSLSPIIDRVNRALVDAGVVLDSFPSIELVESAEELPDLKVLDQNPAWLDLGSQTIRLLSSVWETLTDEVKTAVLAHELGEFVVATAPDLVEAVKGLNHDLMADYFVCRIGLEKELKLSRSERGVEFHNALSTHSNPKEFKLEMSKWWLQRQAGIVQ